MSCAAVLLVSLLACNITSISHFEPSSSKVVYKTHPENCQGGCRTTAQAYCYRHSPLSCWSYLKMLEQSCSCTVCSTQYHVSLAAQQTLPTADKVGNPSFVCLSHTFMRMQVPTGIGV
eukprot:scaffold224992_cov15-Tisochrysis_lutea.AAC.2